MKKSIKVFSCIFLILILLAGCSAEDTQGENEQAGQPVVIVDSVGRQVEIPADFEKIATLDPFAGQCVIMYGYGDQMPATISGVKRDLLLQEISPTLADAAVVKDSGSMNAEAVLALGIDLIFVKSDMYFNDAEKEKLDNVGIPYVVIDYQTIEEQMATFEMIGKALGEEEEAGKMVEWYQDSIAWAESIVAKVPSDQRPSLYHSVNESLRTDIAGSLEAEWIGVTGVSNVSLEDNLFLNEGKTYTNLEQIYAWDPDLIICNETGIDDFILGDPKWQGLDAVKESRVYQIPIGVSRWGHPSSTETSLGIMWLTDLLYHDYTENFDLNEKMVEFYMEFYEYDLTEEMSDRILSGEGIRSAAN